MNHRRVRAALTTSPAPALALAGCSLTGGEDGPHGHRVPSSAGEPGGTVVLVTHESFTPAQEAGRGRSRQESGYSLEVRAAGDAGTLTTKLALTADNPTGDVGLRRRQHLRLAAARRGRLRRGHDVDLPAGAEEYALADGGDRLVPVDIGERLRQRRHRLVRPSRTSSRRRRSTTSPTRRTRTSSSRRGASSSSPGHGVPARPPSRSTATTGRPTGATCSPTTPRSSTAGRTPTTATSPRAARTGTRPIVLSYDSSPAFTVAGRRRLDHRARCSTPASARWSTPACSPAPTTPRAPRR